jgi:uncharacterized membrane protein
LPKQDADIVWRVYRAKEQEIRAASAARQHTLAGVLSALSQPTPDPTTLRAAFKEATDARGRREDLLVGMVIDALLQISPDGRRQLSGELSSRLKTETDDEARGSAH